jgi:hypothetical protein
VNSQITFIFKVLILSAGISALIKYAGPSLPVAATSVNALAIALFPAIVMAIVLVWRTRTSQPGNVPPERLYD